MESGGRALGGPGAWGLLGLGPGRGTGTDQQGPPAGRGRAYENNEDTRVVPVRVN